MTSKKLLMALLCYFCFMLGFPGNSPADSGLTVAVAANFAPAMEEISELFTRKTNIPVQVTFSSSGRLYAHIRSGAPFDLFFSADKKRPAMLFEEGHCKQPVEYVRGSVVLWSRNIALCAEAGSWQSTVSGSGLRKIGITNPELAPYGAAAKEALVEEKLWNVVQDRLVFGANVGQSFQYAATGAADASFIALSLAHTSTGNKGCFLSVPEAGPVAQSACIVCATKNRAAAEEFLTFMASDETRVILLRYGYTEPNAVN
ncbi:MAG: molybdate ABC transporter substrate-binding protein [Desulfobulbaceae bacterium]|nr:molybdate ABC transporter substrate-binding protein [Desulfobulbaceae bacterium]